MSDQVKKPLTEPIKETCETEIETTAPEGDYKDVDLYIEFKSGPLKGMRYRICINYEDYHAVYCP